MSILPRFFTFTVSLSLRSRLGENQPVPPQQFGSFLVDYDKGGVISGEIKENKSGLDTGNSIFLQEIAKPGYPKTYVLNGHIFSLIDIWNYYEYTHNENASIVFNKGLKALKDNLWRYDTNKWSSLRDRSYECCYIK
jgi:hypothetical protein